MPRKRKNRGRKKPPPDYPKPKINELDSGETIDPAVAPVKIAEVFAEDEGDGDDPWGNQDPESFFASPPPPGAPSIPEPAGSQPAQVEYRPPVLADVGFDKGEYVRVGPVTKPNVVDDRRIHLTWVVSEIKIRTQAKDGMVRPEVLVTAMLCAAIYDMVPIADGDRKEPMLDVQPLMREPVELGLPLWLLPEPLVVNPDQISLAMAEKLLAQLFASFPTEIIKTPPPPAAAQKVPDWLMRQIREQKGPIRP